MNDAKVWYVARGSESLGPLTRGELASGFRSGDFGPESLVFKQGMSGWTAASQVAEFRDVLSGGGTSAAPPPPPPSGRLAHEVDYDIVGEEMQFVEIELDPGEGAVAEAGAMMYMTSGIEMTTIFGDVSQKGGGLMDKLLGAGKRVLTGESLFMTEFVNQGSGKQQVAFASPYPGKIMATDLGKMGGKLIAQKDAFLCAAKGVSIRHRVSEEDWRGALRRRRLYHAKPRGDGLAFLHAGGTTIERRLDVGEHLRVDTGCIVALEPSVTYDIQFVGGVKSAILGGEGFFFASLTGHRQGLASIASLQPARGSDLGSGAADGRRRQRRGLGARRHWRARKHVSKVRICGLGHRLSS